MNASTSWRCALDAGGQLRLVVDNHVHAAAVLREHHHQVTEHDVIVTAIPNAPGALAPTLKLVSDANVNVEYAYGGGVRRRPDGDDRPRRRRRAARRRRRGCLTLASCASTSSRWMRSSSTSARRPRAARKRRLVYADAAGTARHHLRRAAGTDRADSTCIDIPPAVQVLLADAAAVHGPDRGDDLSAGPAHARRRARRWGSVDGDVGAGVGGAPTAARAGASLRRQHLLSRAEHAGLLRDADRAGPHRRAAALARRRADSDPQPGLPFGLRPLRRRRRAAGPPAHRQRRRRDPRRDRLRVSAVSHRSLRAPAAAADAVHSAGALGLSPPARHRTAARRRAARRLRRLPDAVVHVLRPLPRPVHGGRLRHDADRRSDDAAASASSRWWSRRPSS